MPCGSIGDAANRRAAAGRTTIPPEMCPSVSQVGYTPGRTFTFVTGGAQKPGIDGKLSRQMIQFKVPISWSDSANAVSEYEKVRFHSVGWAAFAVAKISGSTSHQLEVIHSVPADASPEQWEKFQENTWNGLVRWRSSCMSDKPCFIVVDLKGFINGRPTNKIFLLSWCPERVNIREKMLHSEVLNEIVKKFNLPTRPIEACEADDFNLSTVYARAGISSRGPG
jgi:hypothetical protein